MSYFASHPAILTGTWSTPPSVMIACCETITKKKENHPDTSVLKILLHRNVAFRYPASHFENWEHHSPLDSAVPASWVRFVGKVNGHWLYPIDLDTSKLASYLQRWIQEIILLSRSKEIGTKWIDDGVQLPTRSTNFTRTIIIIITIAISASSLCTLIRRQMIDIGLASHSK
jgi:hypothetical protein